MVSVVSGIASTALAGLRDADFVLLRVLISKQVVLNHHRPLPHRDGDVRRVTLQRGTSLSDYPESERGSRVYRGRSASSKVSSDLAPPWRSQLLALR